MNTSTPYFLTLAEVIAIHSDQIERYGGEPGLRDMALLESAVAMPQVSFDQKYLHENAFEMAAAYAYYLCANHPFVDGNKRTALVSALVFLELNQVVIDDPEELLYDTMIGVAKGTVNKHELTRVLRQLVV